MTRFARRGHPCTLPDFNTWISLLTKDTYTLSDNPCVHVFWLAIAHKTSTNECPVCFRLSVLAVEQRLLGVKVSHNLVVILSTDLTTFCPVFGPFQTPVDK